jgi:hypothetical protein
VGSKLRGPRAGGEGAKKTKNMRVSPVIAPKEDKFFEFALERIEILKPTSTR